MCSGIGALLIVQVVMKVLLERINTCGRRNMYIINLFVYFVNRAYIFAAVLATLSYATDRAVESLYEYRSVTFEGGKITMPEILEAFHL